MLQILKTVGFLFLAVFLAGCAHTQSAADRAADAAPVFHDLPGVEAAPVDQQHPGSYPVFDIQGRHGKGEWKDQMRQ